MVACGGALRVALRPLGRAAGAWQTAPVWERPRSAPVQTGEVGADPHCPMC